MSRLDELIKELCPDGTEWKFISEIADSFTGLTYKPTEKAKTGLLVLRSSNIKNGILDFEDCVFVQMEKVPERTLVKENDILICVRNGSKDLIGKSALIPKTEYSMAFGAFMSVLRAKKNINYKYLFHVWQSPIVQQKFHGDNAMPINQITQKDFSLIKIPVPPLEIQDEIVKVLDNFTELTAELTAELTSRKKQYEYYRELLLNFDTYGEATSECKWSTIKEICDTITNFAAAGSFAEVAQNVPYLSEPDYAQLVRTVDLKSNFSNSNPIYVSKHSYDYLWRVNLDEISIVLPSVGNCGEVYYIEPDKLPYKHNVLAKNALLVRSSIVNMKYLKFIFESRCFQKSLKKITSNMGQSKFNKTDFEKLFVPVPSKMEQERIVSILERFDKLCNDISEGLPAEIEARQKQYEYYRDKLLAFEEKK